MANVAKNIKRLRTAKKLTQEQLAEALHVTRQTVSSWENDRTQPDIDMLTALSAALDTDIEDLIYGKKKHVGLEPPQAQDRRTLSLVLTVFGVLLTAVGLIFMFVFFWNKLPGLTRTALSLLPLLAGAGAGLFTVLKKKESMPAREGAAVLWMAGVMATNALINGLFYVDLGFENLLAADLLLLLPVPFLLDSAFAFTAESVLSVVLLGLVPENDRPVFIFISAAVLLCCFVYVFRNGQLSPVKKYCAWLGLLSGGAYIILLAGYLTDSDGWIIATSVYAFLLALYIADTTKIFSLRLKIPAVCALCVITYGTSTAQFIADQEIDTPQTELLGLLVCAALFFGTAIGFGNRGSYRRNPLRIAFTGLFGAFLAAVAVGWIPSWLALCFAVAVGVLTVISGVKLGRLLPANIGMLMLAGLLCLVLFRFAETDLFWIGLTLLAIGLVFLFANKVMMKKFKAQKQAAAAQTAAGSLPQETEGNEDENT